MQVEGVVYTQQESKVSHHVPESSHAVATRGLSQSQLEGRRSLELLNLLGSIDDSLGQWPRARSKRDGQRM